MKSQLRGAFDKFPGIFVQVLKIVVDFSKIQYVIAIHLMRWQNNFYDFRFKGTATAAIWIHPTKALLAKLASFKNLDVQTL